MLSSWGQNPGLLMWSVVLWSPEGCACISQGAVVPVRSSRKRTFWGATCMGPAARSTKITLVAWALVAGMHTLQTCLCLFFGARNFGRRDVLFIISAVRGLSRQMAKLCGMFWSWLVHGVYYNGRISYDLLRLHKQCKVILYGYDRLWCRAEQSATIVSQGSC